MEVTGDTAENYYAMGDMVKDYRIYLSTMYIGEEVAVFRLAEGKKADDVKAMCQQRIQDLKDSFDGYLPEEYAAVEENDVVAMVTGTKEGVAAAKEVFEKALG